MNRFYQELLKAIKVLQFEIDTGPISYTKLEELDQMLELRDNLAEAIKKENNLC